MHPTIKEFWGQTGIVESAVWNCNINHTIWNIYDFDYTILLTIAINDEHGLRYFYDNKSFSEIEMLKLIKLKAFI